MSGRLRLFQLLRHGLLYLMGLLRETYEAWRDDRAIRLGAGLAYYGLLAFVPLMILAVVLASVFFSQQDIEQYVTEFLDSKLEPDFEDFSDTVADEVETGATRTGLGVVGLISLIIAASFLFLAIEDALKVIWGEPVRVGFKNSLRRRLLAGLVALLAGSLLLVALMINTVLGVASRLAPDLYLLDAATGALVTTASWGPGHRLPDSAHQVLVQRSVSWIALLIGGTVTAIVMNIGTGLVWTYLQTTGDRSVAGVAGGIILFWSGSTTWGRCSSPALSSPRYSIGALARPRPSRRGPSPPSPMPTTDNVAG